MRSPDDVRKLMPSGAELEKRIDGAIDSGAIFGKWPVTAGIRGEPTSVVAAVCTRYRNAGWRIEIVSDPREGDYLQIEAP